MGTQITLNGNLYDSDYFAGLGYTQVRYGGLPLFQSYMFDGLAAVNISVTSSQNWATLTGALVLATDYSSKEYAIGTTATSSKSWATLLAATVDGSNYSSKEYAVGVTYSGGSSKSWATLTGAYVTGTSQSAQEWAVGTYKRGVAGYGSAKDWANYIGGTVDGTLYSALYYSNAAAASAATALNLSTALTATSTSAVAIGSGAKTFTTQSGKNFSVNAYVFIVSNGTSTNWMFGQVTSYSSTTLQVAVTATGGSGSPSDWNITICGVQGVSGSSGNNLILAGAVAGGTANALTVTTQAGISTAVQGHFLTLTTGATDSAAGTATIAADSSGAKSVKFYGSTTLAQGALPANTPMSFFFDGTYWNIVDSVKFQQGLSSRLFVNARQWFS